MKYLVSGILVLAATFAAFSIQYDSESVYSVEEVLKNSESLEGQDIKVRGQVYKGVSVCTQEVCIEEQCCNTCSAGVELRNGGSLKLEGEKIGCSGTNCQLNCTPEVGKEYIFSGDLEDADSPVLNVKEYGEAER